MTLGDLAKLVVRVVALVLFVLAIQGGGLLSVFGVFSLIGGSLDIMSVLTISAITSCLQITVGIVLWIKAEWVARLLVGRDTILEFRTTFSAKQVLSVAIAIAGLFVILESVKSLVQMFTMLAWYDPWEYDVWSSTHFQTEFIAAWIMLFLGMLVVAGSRGAAHLIQRIRTAGVPQEEDSPPAESINDPTE